MKRFISILFLAISTFLSAQDTTVPIALPITFSKVVEVVYEDFAGTNGRSLSGAFAQAIVQGGTFNPTYEGVKDRLTNFRGYEVSALAEITLTSTSVLASWSPAVVINSVTTLEWTVSGGVTIAKTTIDDPTFNFSSNTGTANVLIEKIDNLTEINIGNLGITSADISQSINLTVFFCQQNLLTSFDPTSNTSLINLALDVNSLNSLDITTLTLLTNLSLQQNLFTSFDFSTNNILENIDIRLNPSLTTVNTTGLTVLTTAAFSDCALTSFDISTNILIDDLACNGNSFSAAITNQLLADLVTNGVTNGTLLYRNNETGQGITDRATLITRGWAITNFGT